MAKQARCKETGCRAKAAWIWTENGDEAPQCEAHMECALMTLVLNSEGSVDFVAPHGKYLGEITVRS